LKWLLAKMIPGLKLWIC